MYSKAKFLGHPIHPMLVAFPVAFYTLTLVAFVVFAASGDPFWFRLGTVTDWAGVVMACAAAVPGLLDWGTGIPRNSEASRIGLIHMGLNVTALTIFLVNGLAYASRWHEAEPSAGLGVVLAALGVLVTLPAGFLGWTMVQDHHVGVNLSAAQERLEPHVPENPDQHHPSTPSYANR